MPPYPSRGHATNDLSRHLSSCALETAISLAIFNAQRANTISFANSNSRLTIRKITLRGLPFRPDFAVECRYPRLSIRSL
jgi:hypothetical protein